MGVHAYNLNADSGINRSFNVDLTKTIDELVDYFYSDPSLVHIRDFENYITENKIERQRSTEEYFVEYIMIGLFWKNYAGYASGLSGITKKICEALYNTSIATNRFQSSIDRLRGKVATKHLLKKDNSYELIPIVENFERLIDWLDATKYFIQEHKRLKNWQGFLSNKSPIYVSNFLNSTKELSRYFIKVAQKNLKTYTNGVKSFVENSAIICNNKEDIIFCTRPEDDYYLNMVGVEIINRKHKHAFQRTLKKILVLPICLSSPESKTCTGIESKTHSYNCKACTGNCTVNSLNKVADKHKMEVRITRNESSFSKYVKEWANHPKIGIVAVGCVLSLLSKSYEMIALGIHSQSIFLDFGRCPNHWDHINTPTEIDKKELFSVLNIHQQSRTISKLEFILN